MLAYTDLRDDNLVILVDKGRKTVLKLSGDDLSKVERDAMTVLPIVLNEDWLGRFGFSNGKLFTHPQMGMVHLAHKEDGWYFVKQSMVLNASDPVLFVHELQNFFYELTGKNLQLLR